MAKVEEEDIPKTLLYRHKVLTKPLAFNSMPPLTKKKMPPVMQRCRMSFWSLRPFIFLFLLS